MDFDMNELVQAGQCFMRTYDEPSLFEAMNPLRVAVFGSTRFPLWRGRGLAGPNFSTERRFALAAANRETIPASHAIAGRCLRYMHSLLGAKENESRCMQ